MAGDISNKSLVVLLVLAIAVSLVGTWVSVSKLAGLSIPVLTGEAVSSGTVTLTITQTTLINVTDTSITFASGHVVGDNISAELWSNGTEKQWTGDTLDDYMEVENLGNSDVRVDVQSNVTDNGAESFICQSQTSGVDCGVIDTEAFKFWTEATSELNSCDNGSFGDSGLNGTSVSPVAFAAADTDYVACQNLNFGANNSFKLYLYTKVPADAIGTKAALLTFTAS